MLPLRNVLRGAGAASSSSTGRAALQAVATRAPESTGLETEQWVAADVEAGSPMFSEPLTIDELKAAREDFECSFHSASAQGVPALLEDDEAFSDSSASSTTSVDADQQMQTIQQRALYNNNASSEYLDAALHVAADSGVQRALLDALMNNTDAQAALQRGLAQQGLSINMQFLQTRANLLPPSAAAVASGRAAGVGIEVTDVTDEEPAHEAGALREAGGESLKEALDKITAEVIEKLATFGGRVQSVLQGVMKRWKRRIQGLLNPGRERKSEMETGEEDRAVGIVDGILSAAALIITIALFKRVPLLR